MSVSVALVFPACNAYAPYYIVICDLSGSTVFSTSSHKRQDFQKKRYSKLNVF